MGMITGFVFCSLVMIGNILSVQGTVYSSPDTALKFSKCLIEKMGESQIFSFEDRNNMMEVANVMADTMLNQEMKLPPRILLTAFMTSMADVITHEDKVKNANRKGFYTAALEQCSFSTTGYSDSEFIKLALKILSSIENMKFSKFQEDSKVVISDNYERNSNAEQSNVFNPLAVQPFSVQNPRIPGNFNPNDKTNSDMLKPFPISYPIAANMNPLFHVQQTSNTGISPGADATSVSLKEATLVAMPSSENDQESGAASVSKSSHVISSFGGLNVPQTRESSVVVIPPAVEQPFQNYPLPQQPMKNSEMILQPTVADNAPLPQKDAGDIIPSPSFSQVGVQDQNAPSSSALDSIILNALKESSAFRNAFNFNTPQGNAINLARSIIEKSLEGYNLDIVNEALTSVSNEVAKVSFHTPENYALAISNALIRVLKLHNLSSFTNGSKIATSLVSNLESTKEFSSQAEHFHESFEPSDGLVYSDWNKKQVYFDFQSPPLEPEDTEGVRFSDVLAQYLSESGELSEFFCNSDASVDKMKVYFSIIKSSLDEYSHLVSSIAASVASGILLELSKESLCSNYAKTISEVIAEVLDENRVLQGANAESIAKQMEFSLIRLNVSSSLQNTDSTTVSLPQNGTIDVMPTLPSSFSIGSGVTTTSNKSNQSFVDYVSYEDKNYRTSDSFPGGNYDNDTLPHSSSDPSSSVQMSSKSEHGVNGYTRPITTPYTTEITDEEFTSAATLIEISTSITEASPTERSLNWAPSGVINQEELSTYLLDELESVLEASYYKDSGLEELSSPADDDLIIDEVSEDSAQSDALISASLQSEKNAQNENITKSVGDEKRKNPYFQSGSDVLTERKSISSDYVSEDYVRTKTEGKDLMNEKDASLLTGGFSVKKDLVELQPSFQGPQSGEYPTRSGLPSNSDYDFESKDKKIAEARVMSRIATSSIAYIHSQNFDINNLCTRIRAFAPIVNIPPLVYCSETAAIDYVLNVLNSSIKMLIDV